MLENIPRELRERPSFVLWRYVQREGAAKPTKPPFNANSGWPASVTDPKHWVTFDVASAKLDSTYNGIGYVISNDDPFTFIDLDTHDVNLNDEDRARHQRIADTFTGYAEISPSGKGLHLIVRGKVPSGRRRGGVEIYSSERYMTLTGNVWRAGPIIEQQGLLDILWAELGDDAKEIILASEQPQTEDDYTICERASKAQNGSLFVALYKGEWSQGYASQSEADFALIDLLSFYSRNASQIKRIFRASALGKRDKAKRDNYLDPMIRRSFDNQPPPINLAALKDNLDRQIAEAKLLERLPTPVPRDEVEIASQASADEVYSLPSGLLGDIAKYVYASAPRPVKEVALTAAIGLMAGICGRAYNVNGTGLNHYLLLLASTGSGKEQIATGISMIMQAVAVKVPSALDFMGPSDIRSDAALSKHLAKKSASFLTIYGEFGHTLSQMSHQSNNSHMRGIKKMMLDLYGKSGQGSTLQPIIYSDADKNTLTLQAPAFSFIGESAPEPFFESVDERLISDGLLPRFTLIEYRGKRPPLNQNAGFDPPTVLVEHIAAVAAQCLSLNKAGNVINVQYVPGAKRMLDDFDLYCTELINNDQSEVTKQIWNRAHLRALRLSALLAVGNHPFKPCISVEDARWSINLSQHNTLALLKRFDRGEVGVVHSDTEQSKHVLRMCHQYLTKPYNEIEMYMQGSVAPALHKAKIIPQAYLNKRLVGVAAFRNDSRKATPALNATIKNCCDNGLLVEVNKSDITNKFGGGGKCFTVTDFSALLGSF